MFTVVPLGIVLWFAFTDKDGHFTFGNLSAIVDYAGTFGLSIGLGAIATVLCLVLAYPLAYSISRAGESEIDAAKSGGVSDPRNGTMLKMFNLIDIGERAGSGIPNIFRVWREQGWEEPVIAESAEPDRTVLCLSLQKRGDKKETIKTVKQKNEIILYLTDHASAKSADIAELLDVKSTRVKKLLSELISEGVVVAEGGNRNRTYKLKS